MVFQQADIWRIDIGWSLMLSVYLIFIPMHKIQEFFGSPESNRKKISMESSLNFSDWFRLRGKFEEWIFHGLKMVPAAMVPHMHWWPGVIYVKENTISDTLIASCHCVIFEMHCDLVSSWWWEKNIIKTLLNKKKHSSLKPRLASDIDDLLPCCHCQAAANSHHLNFSSDIFELKREFCLDQP